jgi:hypothetical protein
MDLDDDGLAEIAVASRTGRRMVIHDPGAFLPVYDVLAPSNVRDLRPIRVASGGPERLFVLGVTSSTTLQPLSPGGLVAITGTVPILQSPVRVTPTDLDGDGDLDLAVAGNNPASLRLIEARGGGFPLTSGCGNSDFFLEFNVAFQSASSPDPVDQMAQQFSAWAGQLAGVPDAVRSGVSLDTPVAISAVGCPTRLRVTLRDRAGGPADAAAISVAAAPGAATPLQIGAVTKLGPGEFEVTLIGTGERGEASLIIEIPGDQTPSGRPVRLMPQIEIEADDPADLDQDGDRDETDFDLWVEAYLRGDASADQNRDGAVTPADFSAWVQNSRLGC